MGKPIPNPGSDEALACGCRCAEVDNAHGRGYMGREDMFVITGDCPLHGLGTDWGKPATETAAALEAKDE